MPTARAMEHERNRWRTMTERQLQTRLNKITNPDKLEAFLLLARERDARVLFDLAIIRARELGHISIVHRHSLRSGTTNVLTESFFCTRCGVLVRSDEVFRVGSGIYCNECANFRAEERLHEAISRAAEAERVGPRRREPRPVRVLHRCTGCGWQQPTRLLRRRNDEWICLGCLKKEEKEREERAKRPKIRVIRFRKKENQDG